MGSYLQVPGCQPLKVTALQISGLKGRKIRSKVGSRNVQSGKKDREVVGWDNTERKKSMKHEMGSARLETSGNTWD